MEVNQEEVTRLDSLGAHFKFRDLSARLRLGLQEHTQEKRSSDLLAYQAYFTQNEVVEVKRKQLRAQPTETADVQQQHKLGKNVQIQEPHSSIERQPNVNQTSVVKPQQQPRRQGSIQAVGVSIGSDSQSPARPTIIGHSITVKDVEHNFNLPSHKKQSMSEVQQQRQLYKMGPDNRISMNLANQQQNRTAAQIQQQPTNIVNLNVNQLNLVVSNFVAPGSQPHLYDSATKIGQNSNQKPGLAIHQEQSGGGRLRHSTQMPNQSQHAKAEQQRHISLEEISDYQPRHNYHQTLHLQTQNTSDYKHQQHKTLSKMSSGNRLQRNDLHRSVIDKYSTTQNFAKQLAVTHVKQQQQRLTMESSPMRFNIGQIRAASVMEQASDETRIALDRTKRPQRNANVKEKLIPVSSTHHTAYPKFYDSGAAQQASEYGHHGGKLPVKMHSRLLPKM